MSKPKVLIVAHNHPAVRPGGAEGVALQVYEGVRDSGEFDAIFLARSGPPVSTATRYHEGRPFTLVNDDPNQYFFYTDMTDYDWVFGRSPHKLALTRFYRDFLLAHKPDIVHFQHTMFLGYDILRVTKNTLPDAPIVYTLHEYLPICHHNGQLVRTGSFDLCTEPSPRRCHECFPELSQQTFFMRKRWIQSHLSLVDLFIIPSQYALERYVDWGIPREKLRFEPHAIKSAEVPAEPAEDRPRNRFAYFGQFTPFKGADVLLKAIAILGKDFDGHLYIHGANLDTQTQEFQEKFGKMLDDAGDNVTVVGSYEPEDLGKLMERVDWVVVPSIWWETGPLTVPEAFRHGRPVICSDMGGMSEKVTDGVNGLYFRRRDPDALADVIKRALSTPYLWEELRAGIPPLRSFDERMHVILGYYKTLLEGRSDTAAEAETASEAVPSG